MSETSEINTETVSHPDEVRLRCHRLIDRIARKNGAMKLLQLAERSLTTFEQYKANRKR